MNTETTKKRIKMLTFIVSYKCTNECKHCALKSSPNQEEITIKPEDIRKYLEDVSKDFIIEEVNFFGGEPLLNLNLLINLIDEVKKFKIAKIGLPTNGYWGKDEIIAKNYASKLKKTGVTLIGFSVDAFHQEYIPFDMVMRAIKASYDAGIKSIYVIAQTLGTQEDSNPFNEKTNKMIDSISKEFPFCQIIKSGLQVKGRAIKNLIDYYSLNAIPSEKCLVFKTPLFMIDPYGWVFHQGCQGICLGNAKKESLSKIIGDFKPRKHPIISKMVSKGGVSNLLELAIEKGYTPKEGYADRCHLCFSALNYLRPFYPNILEPSNLYD